MSREGGDPTHSDTPKGSRLSDFAAGRDDVAEKIDEMLDLGYSPEEFAGGRNPFDNDTSHNYPITPNEEKPLELTPEQKEVVSNPENIISNLNRINTELENLLLMPAFDFRRASELEWEHSYLRSAFMAGYDKNKHEQELIENFNKQKERYNEYLKRKPKQITF